MRLSLVLAAVLCLLAAACVDQGPETEGAEDPIAVTTTVTAEPSGCVAPPPDELDRRSPALLIVQPNPVVSGTQATLSVSGEGLRIDAKSSAGVEWQCWDGSGWLTTNYQVVRGFNGDPETNLLAQAADSTIPSIALPLPNEFSILIPAVTPGTYRIADKIRNGETTETGFVIVEVE